MGKVDIESIDFIEKEADYRKNLYRSYRMLVRDYEPKLVHKITILYNKKRQELEEGIKEGVLTDDTFGNYEMIPLLCEKYVRKNFYE